MPKILQKNRTWYQAGKHVCAKARLRNPEWYLSLKLGGHYWRDWSESVNVIGVISEPFARESR